MPGHVLKRRKEKLFYFIVFSVTGQIIYNIILNHITTNKKRFPLNGNHHFIACDGVTALHGGTDGLNRKITRNIIAAKTSIIRKDLASDSCDQRAGGASERNSEGTGHSKDFFIGLYKQNYKNPF